MRGLWAVAIVVLACSASCGASTGTVAAAAVNTSIAATASVARRAEGKCYTWCDESSRCNEETGYCEALPCEGRCKPHERCVKQGVGEKCITAIRIEDTGSQWRGSNSNQSNSNKANSPDPASSANQATPANSQDQAAKTPPRPPWLP